MTRDEKMQLATELANAAVEFLKEEGCPAGDLPDPVNIAAWEVDNMELHQVKPAIKTDNYILRFDVSIDRMPARIAESVAGSSEWSGENIYYGDSHALMLNKLKRVYREWSHSRI